MRNEKLLKEYEHNYYNYDYYSQDKIETEGKYLDVETKIELTENETIYFINLEKVRKKNQI